MGLTNGDDMMYDQTRTAEDQPERREHITVDVERMIEYCKRRGKGIDELTKEEADLFIESVPL